MMQRAELLNAIKEQLDTKLRDNLTPLFCETLNWGALRGQPFTVNVGAPVNSQLTVYPVAQLGGLPVFRVGWTSDRLPNVTQRRAVHRALARSHLEHLLCYVTSDGRQAAFVWARERQDKKVELRTLPYEVGSYARTTIERLGELAFTLAELGPTGEPPFPVILDKLNRAFDVEAVTRRFFEDYKGVFEDLQRQLYQQTRDRTWAHDYALQLLNRIMFLYFIQRKGWIGHDRLFIRHFWEAYKGAGQPGDTFFNNWLSVLFFEAFNERFQAGRADYQKRFPKEIRDALAMAPYLNGGLFTRNRLDDEHSFIVPDSFFETLFDSFDGSRPGFLERYNFTIAESSPFDREVAVDPEMIGKVYESLVNITAEGLSEEDLRGSAGIFYTPA